MKIKKLYVSVFLALVFLIQQVPAFAVYGNYLYYGQCVPGNYPGCLYYQNLGYDCYYTMNGDPMGWWYDVSVHCFKMINTYSAVQPSTYTLTGTLSTWEHDILSDYFYEPCAYMCSSPFIYLHNAPEGTVSVKIDSSLDTYAPLPAFTTPNGWNIDSKDGSLFVDNKKVDNLFYELVLPKLTLNRNGKNFSSKKELISYLKTSPFLDKMGFSEEEKKNTLGYIIPKIQKAEDTEYYYLTVLTQESVAEVSTLNITPKPNRIDRHYYSIYPTNVPVHTEGDFKFPVQEKENGFTVKETGELLVQPGMVVFFK